MRSTGTVTASPGLLADRVPGVRPGAPAHRPSRPVATVRWGWRAAVCRGLLRLAAPFAMAALPAAHAGEAAIAYQTAEIVVGGTSHPVTLPAGFRLDVLTEDLDGPRLLTFGPNGDLFIGSRSGNVYRLPPPYRQAQVLLRLGGYPHSVAFRAGEILIARTDGVYRAPYRPGQERIRPADVTLLAALPGGGGHNSRTLAIGPDGRVYVSLGISGNCSDQYLGEGYPFEDRRGGVLVLDETGAAPQWRPYAAGLRNPVGFDWHPATGVMYASNNGPDHWGFEQPPEYFARLEAGAFLGMPWFQFDGTAIRRDDCVRSRPPRPQAEVTAPVLTFPARNAPMAVAFVPAGGMIPEFAGDAVVALHGSWATRPHGQSFGDPASRRQPKLIVARFLDGKALRVDDLVTGFQLPDGRRWARPVGVAVGPDGALYFTSDAGANALFRLSPDPASRGTGTAEVERP